MTTSAPVTLYVLDPLERAARTFVQQFSVLMLAGGSASLLLHQNWLVALDSAGFAAIVSILTSVLTFKVPPQSKEVDLGLRVLKTFVQAFLGTLIAANILSVAHADWKGALAVAVPVAFTALLSAAVPSLVPPGTATAVDADYEPGEITDPSVPLDEDGHPVVDDVVDVAPEVNAGNSPAGPDDTGTLVDDTAKHAA